ncbi:MAG: hypothetical protein IGR92_18465 [Leptolyngbyaceae cyanobacterium T60_A2020_046]|nr:hypothetical protein [Leptolyngbyaceae cyanobacterium T60_A2020_046]
MREGKAIAALCPICLGSSAMSMPDASTLERLHRILCTYLDTDGQADSRQDLRSLVGAMLALEAKADRIAAHGLELESWVKAVVQSFDPAAAAAGADAEDYGEIAAHIRTWREALAVKAKATLDASVQKHAPNLATAQVPQVLLTILPLVEEAQITRAEAERVLGEVMQHFIPQDAQQHVIDSHWLMLADKVRDCLQHDSLEAAVIDVVRAYAPEVKPDTTACTDDLVATALNAVLNYPGHLANLGVDVDLDLNAETQRLVVQQVTFKLHLAAAAPPSKTARDIAQ